MDNIRDLFPVVRSGNTDLSKVGVMPFVAPAIFVDFRRADEVIPVVKSMHGIGAGTHNNFMDTEEHRRLIDWIAGQLAWLDAVTILEETALQRTKD